jgi:glycosyltransferase involved in cell wall biosynthesis
VARIKYVRTIVTQLIYLPRLVRELRRADVVHVFSASYFSFVLAPLPAVLIARLFGRPVLMNYRSGEAPDHLERSAVARWTLRHADQNVVPSRFLQVVFAAHGIAARIIPNTIDRERFSFRLREPLRPRLLSTRNFEPLYNVACTVRAFALVQGRYPEATLTLVGAGSQEGALRQLAAALGLRNVTFAGRVAPKDIWQHYAEADIYVQTPNIDNMPSSILEAYASGLPVVSTNTGGVPSMLADGVHGLLASVDDEKHVAEHVIRLLEDATLARGVALAAHDLTEALVWDRVRDQWLDVYRGLLNNPAAEPGTVTPT